MKCLFFKSPNPNHSHFPQYSHNRPLRLADILATEDDAAAVNSMDAVHKKPPYLSHRSTKCFSPRRILGSFLAALRPNKDRRILKSREKLPSTPITIELKGNEEESRQLNWNDTSFKLGVGCGLLYVIAATKNELSKMVELRKEMGIVLQNMKGEIQSKDVLLNRLKQCDDALAEVSVTDFQEVSCSNSHLSVGSEKSCCQAELKGNTGCDGFLDYDIREQGECAEEINELQAEFEYELQRLQVYLDGEAAFEEVQQERVEVVVKDSSSKSESSSFGEIIVEHQEASYDTSVGVSPVELERRLHELLETRLQERITELESALEYATQKLNEKEIRSIWWEDTARHIPYHVPETSRFTFPLDPEAALKFNEVVG
ncbi:protein POLAR LOCALIZATION DURING ASYMMETRIC DIVISION AND REDISTRIBUTION-like [Vicia villosa]|uniref:protein POLAR LOCALIZATION DURING ASYMMETRIC DIVISION AND REDISTRIBUTION-like n=1 Tax=Vicia villosa TaxID=3911 RepID=UPI00273AF984|nr:protein POLAR LOCALIZATION DURING ASYMMETRIC DIVISION AND REDISTRIBUTION-like [Vicia villosa]